jgi:hypothetical protein
MWTGGTRQKAVPDLELPGHGEGEALVRDVVPLVGKVESPDVHHQLTLHVLHVVMQRRDEMPDTRENYNNKTCPFIVNHLLPLFLLHVILQLSVPINEKAILKGSVSRDVYFCEGLNILIGAFCVCADGLQGLSKAFTVLYNY